MPVAILVLAGLVALEWYVRLDFSLGVLYTIPVIMASAALNRWQIVAFGLFAAAARTPFTPAASSLEALLKFTMASLAYIATGLLLVEMSRSRRRLLEMFGQVQLEQHLRRRAEEQFRALAESSPAAILTLNESGAFLVANRAAHDMLGVESDGLVGLPADRHFPMFANALSIASHGRDLRTSVTGWARRADGHQFPIQAWFSVYGVESERRLAAIVVDVSEEVRTREREQFEQLLDHNRLLASAVSHEIRNMSAAISVVCSNLNARSELRGNADLEALVQLVDGLMELASFELRKSRDRISVPVDLKAVLDQLRVVIEPDWEEIGGEVVWDVPEGLSLVTGDAQGLLQILLNLCQNSLRAVEGASERRLVISARTDADDVCLTISDTGPGVASPEQLFHLHPDRTDFEGHGLGLYISRELARSVGGDLRHVPAASGAQFQLVVPRQQAEGRGRLAKLREEPRVG